MLRSRCSITAMSGPMKQEWSARCHSAKVGFLDSLHERHSQKTEGFLKLPHENQKIKLFFDLTIEIARSKVLFFEVLHENPRKLVFWTWWLKFPENKGLFYSFDLLIEIPRKQRFFVEYCTKNKVVFDLMIEIPRKQRVFLTYCMKIQRRKNNGNKNPGIYTAFSVLDPQILEFTACSMQRKTLSRKQPHYQLFSRHRRVQAIWRGDLFRSRAAGFGVIISRKNWTGN